MGRLSVGVLTEHRPGRLEREVRDPAEDASIGQDTKPHGQLVLQRPRHIGGQLLRFSVLFCLPLCNSQRLFGISWTVVCLHRSSITRSPRGQRIRIAHVGDEPRGAGRFLLGWLLKEGHRERGGVVRGEILMSELLKRMPLEIGRWCVCVGGCGWVWGVEGWLVMVVC